MKFFIQVEAQSELKEVLYTFESLGPTSLDNAMHELNQNDKNRSSSRGNRNKND